MITLILFLKKTKKRSFILHDLWVSFEMIVEKQTIVCKSVSKATIGQGQTSFEVRDATVRLFLHKVNDDLGMGLVCPAVLLDLNES